MLFYHGVVIYTVKTHSEFKKMSVTVMMGVSLMGWP